MTPRPQPRKPDALDLAETLVGAANRLRIIGDYALSFGGLAALSSLQHARDAAQRVLAAIDEYEGRS